MREGAGCSTSGARMFLHTCVCTCSHVLWFWLNFYSSVFTCSANAVFKCSNRMPLIY